MLDTTRTTTILLEGLHDVNNSRVWQEFDGRYRPILVAFARRLGMSDADASDVAQDTIMQFVKEYREGKYDRSRARLRAWLVGIARYRVAGVYRKRAAKREARGDSAFISIEDDAELQTIFDAERRRHLLQCALDELRTRTRTSDRTIRAFEMLAMQNMPVAAVAESLEMSTHDVYLAKSRVAGKLRSILEELDRAYDDEDVT